MATITKNLGPATAYGYAKEQGYTGTEEQYAELMASYATVAEQAAASATAAAGSADTASTKATAAANSATAASNSATTATTKAGEAATSATNAANSANTANTKAGEAASSATAASGSATTASTKAGEASASATAAAGSATDANTAKVAAQAAQTAAEQAVASVSGLAEQIEQNTSDVAVIGNDVSDLKSALTHSNDTYIAQFLGLTATYIQDGSAGASNYYKQVTALNTAKKYDLVVSVPETDTYLIQAGINSTAGSMVDTIYSGVLAKGDNLISGYQPTGAWTWIRNDHNVSWALKVYQHFATPLETSVAANASAVAVAPKVKTISTSDFSNSPYNNLIGNLDNQSIVNITPSHNALDYPFDESGYYTIITAGESASPSQIAIKMDGKMATRKKSSTGWKPWAKGAWALEYSDITLSGSTPAYTDFDDFPVGSVITISSLKLDHSPEGYANTGHDVMDTGVITGNVFTFATKADDPFFITQICVYIGASMSNIPRIACRNAMLISGAYTWTAWSTLSQNGVIHSTNKIVDINSYSTYTFSDFNDAPINTIYQVDFNVEDNIAHNPEPGKTGNLMTYGFSDNSRHALVQIYITKDGPNELTASMHYRYCVEVGTHTYVWTDWLKVKTVDNAVLIENKGRLANGSDLNDVVDNAVYLLGNQATAEYEHSALSSGGGYLTVRANGDICQQIIDAFDGTRYSRYSSDAGTTWNSWN